MRQNYEAAAIAGKRAMCEGDKKPNDSKWPISKTVAPGKHHEEGGGVFVKEGEPIVGL